MVANMKKKSKIRLHRDSVDVWDHFWYFLSVDTIFFFNFLEPLNDYWKMQVKGFEYMSI
jgi:hypothetical protein